MKHCKLLWIVFISVFICNILLGQVNKNNLVPFLKRNGTFSLVKYGTNIEVTTEAYDDAEPLNNGFAKVRKESFWGVINTEGKIIVPISFISINDYDHGYIIGQKEGSSVIMDEKGNEIANFSEELAKPIYSSFNHHAFVYLENGVYLDLLNKSVNTILSGEVLNKITDSGRTEIDKFKIELKKPFDESGLAIYSVKSSNPNDDWEYDLLINLQNKIFLNYITIAEIDPGVYKCLKEVTNLSQQKEYIYGCVDENNKLLIPFRYARMNEFRNGFCGVQLNESGNTGFINRKGEIIFPLIYAYKSDYFSDGLLPTYYEDKATRKSFVGYFDSTGKIRFSIPFNNFSTIDYSYHSKLVGTHSLNKNESKYSFINTKGEEVISSLTWETSKTFIDGFNIIKSQKEDKWGVINNRGSLVLPIQFDKIYYYYGGYVNKSIPAEIPDYNQYFVSFSDNEYIASPYTYVHNGFVKVELHEEHFFVDVNGKIYKE